jgi:cytochrome c-type biogenesis protein CcmE
VSPRRRRLAILASALLAGTLAIALLLYALRGNLVFFYTPSQVWAHEAPAQRLFRMGGLVREGSLRRDGLQASFVVTDGVREVRVRHHGLLPDLFREGRGVVVQGRMGDDGAFDAHEVLAKHDENYVPPPAAQAMRAGPP